MDQQLENLLHTGEQINEYFVLETLLLSTRTADLYKALDKSRGTHISLWVGKGSIGINTGAVRKFLERMAKLQRIEPAITKILSFGVDSLGVPFCVFPNLDGHPASQGNLEPAEAERRLMSCIRILDKVHANDLICGDVCANSFWSLRAGDVIFIGVMGIGERDYIEPRNNLNADTAPYVAPEQIEGQEADYSTDVYSMGVLGFKMLTGDYPFGADVRPRGDKSIAPAVTDLIGNPPVWANQVMATSLSPNPEERYSKAGSILAAIYQIRENNSQAERAPTRTVRDAHSLTPSGGNSMKIARPISSTAVQKVEPPTAPKPSRSFLLKGVFVVLAVFVASFAIFAVLFRAKKDSNSSVKDAFTMHESALQNDQMQSNVVGSSKDIKEKEASYQKMVLSDDPIHNDILIKAAKDAPNDEERFLAETAILDRARRLGLRRSTEIVRPWLRTLKTGQLPATYEAMLRSLDTTLPPEAIDSSLRQAYTAYSRMVLRLTASLALDTGKLDQYQEVLAQLLGDATGAKDLNEHSLIALILYSTELVSVFGDDAIQKREQIPDKDIVWLLDILAARNDINVRAIASLAVERKLLSPMRQTFLASIRDRQDLPLDILNSLVKAAAGTITAGDIANFGNWFDRLSEDILLAICADTPNMEAKLAAFDILAAKSFSKEPASSLIQWVREKAWDKRESFVEPIGVLSYLDFFPEDKVLKAFVAFDSYIKDQKVIGAFLDSNDERLVKETVKRYAKNIGLGRRIVLLSHKDKEIRMMAIKSLEGINDLAGLKIILDYYHKEKDPEVRKLYSDTFWMIKEKYANQ